MRCGISQSYALGARWERRRGSGTLVYNPIPGGVPSISVAARQIALEGSFSLLHARVR